MALCDLCFVQLELRWFPPWKKVLGQLKLGSRKWCFLPWQKVLGQLKLGSRKWCHGKGNGQRHAQGYLRRHGMLSENFRPENQRCTPFIGYGMLTPTSTKKTTKFVEHSSSSTEPTKKRFVGFEIHGRPADNWKENLTLKQSLVDLQFSHPCKWPPSPQFWWPTVRRFRGISLLPWGIRSSTFCSPHERAGTPGGTSHTPLSCWATAMALCYHIVVLRFEDLVLHSWPLVATKWYHDN